MGRTGIGHTVSSCCSLTGICTLPTHIDHVDLLLLFILLVALCPEPILALAAEMAVLAERRLPAEDEAVGKETEEHALGQVHEHLALNREAPAAQVQTQARQQRRVVAFVHCSWCQLVVASDGVGCWSPLSSERAGGRAEGPF